MRMLPKPTRLLPPFVAALRNPVSPFLQVALLLLLAPAATAQRNPRIGYAFPAGGQVGNTFEVRLAGQFLDGVDGVRVSGGGVEAKVLEHVKPLTGRQLNLLRDRIKALQEAVKAASREAREITFIDPAATNVVERLSRSEATQELAEMRARVANPKNRDRENRQLSEDVRLKLSIAADATPGTRELRLRTATGLSNPVVFRIGRLPEFIEHEPNENPAGPTRVPQVPAVVNGQILPGDVDCFSVRLKQGMRLVAAVSARQLIPYLADAVPGWFQATLTLRDPDGNEVGYSDDFRFQPDPLLCFEVPRDGDYRVEIQDSIFRGREDFVYRIVLGELPCLTGLFPLGGPAGETTAVELAGWNLPVAEMDVTATPEFDGIRMVSVPDSELSWNRLPFAVDRLPERREQEPNDLAENAQEIELPVILNGRMERRDDRDCFRFNGRRGQDLVAEVTARRLESPLDSGLRIFGPDGAEVAFNDDHEDPGAGLETHHADSYVHLKLPADGPYLVQLTDTQHRGGSAFAYRLRLSAPQPDFALRVVPSAVNLRPGASAALTVYALRRDGFTNGIELALSDAPRGLVLNSGRPTWIPAGRGEVTVNLFVPRAAVGHAPVAIGLEGRARIAGQQVIHPAVPADDLMQAFIYRHLVPAQEWVVSVFGRPPTPGPFNRVRAALQADKAK
ncbi:MAG: hypothetical protein KDM81_06045 [Verrucomicrobiae bacterium]|nr:hypothetical protein [Verrucomicrobiae bacterium]